MGGKPPQSCRLHGRAAACDVPNSNRNAEMNRTDAADRDPNAELRSFEPLRVTLAVGALLLGLLMGLH
jgi:hypothetical protein